MALVVAYSFTMLVLIPAMVAGTVPVISAVASRYGYDAPVFQDFAERIFPSFAWVAAALGAWLYGRAVRSPDDPDAAWRRIAAAVAAATAVVLLLNTFTGPVRYRGDANDYLLTGISTANHLTPDLRDADVAEYSELRVQGGVISQSPYDGYFESPRDGKTYSWHFWLYPLAATPLHWALDAAGVLPLRSLELLNVLMYGLAMLTVLRTRSLSGGQQALFVLLFTCGPVVWYASWPSAEVFSASLVAMGIAFALDRRSTASLLCVALATMQNPSLLPLVAAMWGWTLVSERGSLSPRRIAVLTAASMPAILAPAFFFAMFGVGNLIQGAGMASLEYASPAKVVDFFLSLDQGVLPYAPVVLAGGAVAAIAATVRRDWWAGLRVAALLAAVTMTTTTIEWNSDAAGIRRHALWLLPVLIWLIVELFGRSIRRRDLWIAALVGAQAIVAAYWVYPPAMTSHSSLCETALRVAPELYRPLPEVFAPRTTHLVEPIALEAPICYCCESDQVSEILVDAAHMKSIDDYLILTDEGRAAIAGARPVGDGLYYATPPQGSARLRVQDARVTTPELPIDAVLGGPSQYGAPFERFNRFGHGDDGTPEAAPLASYAIYVTVHNAGDAPWYPGGSKPIGLVVDVTGGGSTRFGPIPLVRAVMPGEDAVFYAHFETPADVGRISVDARLVQTDGDTTRTLSAPSERFTLDVVPVPTRPDLTFERWTDRAQ